MQHRTDDRHARGLLAMMDEYSRECAAIDLPRQLEADDVLDRLTWPFAQRGPLAKALRDCKAAQST